MFKFIALAGLVCLLSVLESHASELPEMGDPSATMLTPAEDYRLGQAFMRSLRQNVEINDDPELNAYINSLGYRLLAAADTHLPFTFFIVDDASINAFAGPGGYIGIHSGLILAAKSEGELAAVMAHEIAHVTQRHLARAFQKASASQLQTAAAILAAILLGSPEFSAAMITSAAAGSIQQQLNFTRSHEQEADRVGIDILVNSGFDPDHMPGFFQRLQEAYRYMESNLPELLRTHPVTPNRIADSQNRARQYPHRKEQLSPSFPYAQAKLRAMDKQEQPHRLQTLEAEQTLSPVEQYELALLLTQQGKLERAARLSRALLKESAESAHLIALQARIDIDTGKPEKAAEQLQKALLILPAHPQLTMLYAEALLQTGQARTAADAVRELIQQQPQFVLPSYYRLLAKTEFAGDRKGNAYMAMADYYVMIGQNRTAIEQLENALQQADENNRFQQERIKAALDRLKLETLEQKNDPLNPEEH